MRLAADFAVTLGRGAFHLDAAFSLDDGVLVLFGPSGSGKSTTLACLAGLLAPHSGQIRLDGRVVDDPAARVHVPARQRQIGYVPQSYALFPHLRALDNILFGTRTVRRQEVGDLIEALDLSGLETRFPHQLSGGQRQRVAIARALVRRPRLLLLDEPFASLDRGIRARLRRLLKEVRRAYGVPAVLVTHDVGDAVALGDRAVLYSAGRTVKEGRPIDLFCPEPEVGAQAIPGRLLALRVEASLAVATVQIGEATLQIPMPAEMAESENLLEDEEVLVLLGQTPRLVPIPRPPEGIAPMLRIQERPR